MNEQVIHEQYQHITSLLKQKRLKEAQIQLEAFLRNANNDTLRLRLEQTQTSYYYLLQYLRSGIEDPERNKLYKQLLTETWEIADQTNIELLDTVSTHLYHNLRQRQKQNQLSPLSDVRKKLEAFSDDLAVCQLVPNNQENTERILKQHEETIDQLFYRIWCNTSWDGEETKEMQAFLTSDLLSVSDLCLITSAVMLSLLECFDAQKLGWLLDAYTHSDAHISQRALVQIAIIIQKEKDRLPFYSELTARLSLLNDEKHLGQQLNRVYIQLLNSKETEKINKKMQEEIIPGMIKSINTMKAESEDEDLNPDWEDAINHSELGDKIREMNDLQQEGADIYMGTFAQLKGYPFFRQVPNWFRPFDTQHSSIYKEFSTYFASNSMLKLILKNGPFCDNDKYSLCFMMRYISDAQRSVILSQFNIQNMESMDQLINDNDWSQHAKRAEVISNLYIQDLYRFFKLSNMHTEFYNIFEEEIALHRIPTLKDILRKPEFLKTVADFHFKKEHPIEAIELYQILTEEYSLADADIFQKMGFCLQKQKRYQEAITAYRKADIIKPDHIWTLRHLATCYRLSRNYEAALEHYKKVEAMQPKNTHLLFHIGSCLTGLSRYDEALQYFFKMDFMENDSIKAWRAIGWCSFMIGKYEQAMKYYDKVIKQSPVTIDYLNAGHVAWVLKNLDRACDYYGQAINACNNNKETFLELFYKDKEILLQRGVPEKDIPLVLDLL